jgi:hypothetical protein
MEAEKWRGNIRRGQKLLLSTPRPPLSLISPNQSSAIYPRRAGTKKKASSRKNKWNITNGGKRQLAIRTTGGKNTKK